MRADRRLVIGVSVLFGCIAPAGATDVPLMGPRAETPGVLHVPYVAQSELLCGGAAVAMVERWWGRRGVYAEEFASLVRPAAGGILTTDLAQATRARGWQAQTIHGTAALVQQSLRDSIPVIALIKVGGNRYHYVVIVGWNADLVVFHDPAMAPFASLKASEFLRRWSGADQWAMLVRPSASMGISARPADPPPAGSGDSLPCSPWLDEAAGAAAANHLEDADRFLAAAAMACPTEPLVLRELAGVRFLQGRQAEAMRLADEYLRRAPGDALGWQLLASSRYLTGDADGALTAWNAIGRPVVDLLGIEGIRHIRFQALANIMMIAPRLVLTPGHLARAQRRIADVPALAGANVTYAPLPGGMVEVDAAVVERPTVEPILQLIVGGALRAAVRGEAGLTVNTPFGAGEAWRAQWRWQSANPRRAVRLDIPVRIGLPGVASLEGSWEQYRFEAGVQGDQRRASAIGFSSWIRGGIEAMAGARFERWTGSGDFLALSLGGALHGSHDRMVLLAQGERAVPFTDQASYTRVRTQVAWTSPVGSSSLIWSMRLGGDWTSAAAPRGLWPIAGGDLAREIPLRAHSLIVGGRLSMAQTGQGVIHGGVAADRPVAIMGPITLGAGAFLDGADVIRSADDVTRHQRYLDGGVGLRIGLVGMTRSALRVDLARGFVTDPRWGLSVGLEQSWPPRLHGLQ